MIFGLEKFLRTWDHVGEGLTRSPQRVVEDPDELGYSMIAESGSITPSIYRGTVATKETQRILCGIAHPGWWEEIEDAAIEWFETEGPYEYFD